MRIALIFSLFIGIICMAATCKEVPPNNCIDESKINLEAPCTKIYKPVCGCDGKTYGNECVATNAGLLSWKEGECCIDESKIDPDAACIEIYKPVCGCDGKTYSNDCFARVAGLTSWEEGECQ